MRIISGIARGRKLNAPAGNDIRPTSGMVKESVFNIVQFDIEGRRILDLFAGTGQLGIEALSRGASAVVFIDSASTAIRRIQENIKLSGFSDSSAVVLQCDAIDYIKKAEPFDLIFIDPPYNTPLAQAAVEKIIEFDKLRGNGIIICETKSVVSLPDCSAPYNKYKEYRYGSVKLTKYIKSTLQP